MTSRTELKFQQRLKTKPVSKTNQKSDKDLDKKRTSSFELSEIISPQADNNNDDSTNSDIEDISQKFIDDSIDSALLDLARLKAASV